MHTLIYQYSNRNRSSSVTKRAADALAPGRVGQSTGTMMILFRSRFCTGQMMVVLRSLGNMQSVLNTSVDHAFCSCQSLLI